MVQSNAQPIYQLVASLLAVVPFVSLAAAFLISLPSHLAARAARRMVPARARAINYAPNAVARRHPGRRSY
jgi:hypothetical protein